LIHQFQEFLVVQLIHDLQRVLWGLVDQQFPVDLESLSYHPNPAAIKLTIDITNSCAEYNNIIETTTREEKNK